MAFITTWTTTGADETITIPCGDIGTYNATIDWGDASADSVITTFDDADLAHTYAVADTYTVTITGDLPWIRFNNGGDKLKIKTIEQWGSGAGDIGWLSGNGSFYGCANLEDNSSDTPDMSNVENLGSMFRDCAAFNGDIGSWDVSAVMDMTSTFRDCDAFNQDIGSWDVSSAKNMTGMFLRCPIFNQDIGSWDTSSVSNMNSMFNGCTALNQDIGRWYVSSVTDMAFMFLGCSIFNQDIGSWDVSSVTTMSRMFDGCTAFNQDIGSWDITSVTTMASMFNGVTLSITNYDRLLIGWEAQIVQDNVNFHGGNSVYCYGADARAALVADHTWTITDGGEDAGPCVNPFAGGMLWRRRRRR